MNRILLLASAALAAGLTLAPQSGYALPSYQFNLDTSGLAGQDAVLAFDFIQGANGAAGNTVTVSGLSTDGVLGNGNPFALNDAQFFNETLRAITFGDTLNFSLQLTEIPDGFFPDEFSFYVLDPTATVPLVTTTDPSGAESLFLVDITGAAGGSPGDFQSTTAGVSWTLAARAEAAPEGASTLMLLLVGGAGLFAWRRWNMG